MTSIASLHTPITSTSSLCDKVFKIRCLLGPASEGNKPSRHFCPGRIEGGKEIERALYVLSGD
jgi:hypothetical protein